MQTKTQKRSVRALKEAIVCRSSELAVSKLLVHWLTGRPSSVNFSPASAFDSLISALFRPSSSSTSSSWRCCHAEHAGPSHWTVFPRSLKASTQVCLLLAACILVSSSLSSSRSGSWRCCHADDVSSNTPVQRSGMFFSHSFKKSTRFCLLLPARVSVSSSSLCYCCHSEDVFDSPHLIELFFPRSLKSSTHLCLYV